MVEISTLKFNEDVSDNLRKIKYAINWSLVYIINNEYDAYIGETTDVSIRPTQHLSNEIRRKLREISIISDETFNKSSILELGSFFIKFMSAESLNCKT